LDIQYPQDILVQVNEVQPYVNLLKDIDEQLELFDQVDDEL
jgi:hypothetical protein